jgi:hypothetical protein
MLTSQQRYGTIDVPFTVLHLTMTISESDLEIGPSVLERGHILILILATGPRHWDCDLACAGSFSVEGSYMADEQSFILRLSLWDMEVV